MALSNNYLDQFLIKGNNAIHFKLIRSPSDLENNDIVFHPEMCHQHFGALEAIFGYRGLRVNLYYSAGLLEIYLDISYSSSVNPKASDGVPPDDVEKILASKMPKGYYTNLDIFSSLFTENRVEEKFKPFGNLKHTYSCETSEGVRHFEIYALGYGTGVEPTPSFLAYHERLQTFLLFFVDAASYIDATDEFWTFYLIYERYRPNGNSVDEPWRYATVGYMTVYHFYAYPDRKRPRVSQVLVLPPFQRSGHGQQLLKVFYRDCYANSGVRDITVEDPSDNFQRMRDFVDCSNCRHLPEFSPEKLFKGFSAVMLERCREKFRLNRRQSRRVYEILRLYYTDSEDEEQMRQFRLCVKQRLNAAIMRTTGRGKQAKSDEQDVNNQANSLFSQENRWRALQQEFDFLLEEYRPVVEKLKMTED